MEQIGILLAAAREAAGMTQVEVAASRHVTRGAQSQIELPGARPGWDTIDSFARAIDASVTIRFDLANGVVVSGRCAGIHRPTLAADLGADAERARHSAVDAGWKVDREGHVHRATTGFGEFQTVARLVPIVEPANWMLQSALTVLMSAAAANPIDGGQGSLFGSALNTLLSEDEDTDAVPVYDVTTESQIALNALLDATHTACWMAKLQLERPLRNLEALPVRGLASYLAAGSPGSEEVSALVERISLNAEWRLAILREAGYLYGEPSVYEQLPHIVFREP